LPRELLTLLRVLKRLRMLSRRVERTVRMLQRRVVRMRPRRTRSARSAPAVFAMGIQTARAVSLLAVEWMKTT
jgi:hypothetical protein